MEILNNLPKNWSDIPLNIYKEFISLDLNDFEDNYELLKEQLAVLMDISSDDEYFDELDLNDLLIIIDNIKWLNNEPINNYKKEIDNYKIKDLNNITLGEFIDLDYYFKTGSIENLHLLCSILYKQYKIDEWNNTIEEPYIYDIHIRSEHFLKEPISNIYGIINYFYKFKENFINNYTGIFTSPDDDLDLEGLDQNEINEIKKEIEEDKKRSEFSWQLLVFDLTNGDLTKFESVCGLSLIYVFNTIAMKKAMKL